MKARATFEQGECNFHTNRVSVESVVSLTRGLVARVVFSSLLLQQNAGVALAAKVYGFQEGSYSYQCQSLIHLALTRLHEELRIPLAAINQSGASISIALHNEMWRCHSQDWSG